MNTTTTAEALAARIAGNDPDPYHMASAELYAVDEIGDAVKIDQHPNVYGLIAENVGEIPDHATAVVVVTTGWAAPLNENGEVEGAPSEHAQRERVRLSVYVPRDAAPVSVVMFASGRETVTDENHATGTLADAIAEMWW